MANTGGILNRANHVGTQPLSSIEGFNTEVNKINADVIRLNRSLTRLGDVGQTMHADFKGNAYGIGSPENGVDLPMLGEELFSVQRAGPKWEQAAEWRGTPGVEVLAESVFTGPGTGERVYQQIWDNDEALAKYESVYPRVREYEDEDGSVFEVRQDKFGVLAGA